MKTTVIEAHLLTKNEQEQEENYGAIINHEKILQYLK